MNMRPEGARVSSFFSFGPADNPSSNSRELQINPERIPVLPMRNVVVFEHIPVPVPLGRESSIKICEEASEGNYVVVCITQKDPEIEDPMPDDLYKVGVVAQVVKVLELPDGSRTAFLTALDRAKAKRIWKLNGILEASITLTPLSMGRNQKEISVLMATVMEKFREFLELMGEEDSRELRFTLEQLDDPMRTIDFICMNAPMPFQEKQKMLEAKNMVKRLEILLQHIDQAVQLMRIRIDIQSRTHSDISAQQREQFLQQQMRAIQSELGGSDDEDIQEFEKRAEGVPMTEAARAHFDKELKKLGRLNLSSADYSVQFGYLDTFLSLPWENFSQDEIDLRKVERTLDRDHYGLNKVKERILEHISVLKLRGDLKAPIICLLGPPGVGKTSLGRSIADALGREYARISLGGLHDEAEIRGHRKTYVGAMPGRIISALQKCKTGNPVFVLDEIDKIGSDYKGDPAQALLEVLDPEQNTTFHDNYVDFDYDLSKVLFLATANSISPVSAPLRDRMEIIDISGYITEEKTEIAKRHLLPRQLEQNGFQPKEISIRKDAMIYLVERYTRESGVRQLEKTIGQVLRKIARMKASGKEYPAKLGVADIRNLLGKETVNPDMYENNDYTGVVTGLAWTQVGGEILFIESSLSKGKGNLTMTGNLGDVMKESATLALQFLRSHADLLGIDPTRFAETDVHIHVPEGAIPKDGPSAGITMVTSLASSFTGRKVRPNIAMTGEITLRGKVLPVGGIKEKILAAKRAGIKEIILSRQNEPDILEIDSEYLSGLGFRYVDRIEEVLEHALM